jgi:sarcosine oxidase subunit alpha
MIDGQAAWTWLTTTIDSLNSNADRVKLLPRTQAFGYFAQNFVALTERVTDQLSAPDRSCRASGCGRFGRKR